MNTDFNAQWRQLVFPATHENPKPAGRYHLCVIGAGPAGLVTAIAAAGLGAKVALIERQAMGGDCLNVGCVPSKALLEFTRHNTGPENFERAFNWLRKVRADISRHDSVERYSDAGVDVFLGEAAFADAHTVVVDGTEIKARRFVIATGARAGMPPIPGIAEAGALTNESIFELQSQPASLAIIGGGAIGCELAQVFARLGTKVDLIEIAPRILQTEHNEASALVERSLSDAGVRVKTGATISGIRREPDKTVSIELADGTVIADQLLVAAGRRANTERLNLEAAGVDLTERGLIAVDDRLRTTNKRIFAAGDVCSPLQFTHHADAHARLVVQNALFFATGKTGKIIVPHCTYTQPEVAQVGELAESLSQNGIAYDAYRIGFGELDRGKAEGDTDGFAEVLTRKGSDEILGATIVGHDAGEQIASLCIAMNNKLGLGSMAATLLPYPTRSEFVRRLADQYNRTRLTPTVSRMMRKWFQWTA